MNMNEKEMNALHTGHRERMRKRFIKTGFEGFTEHEVLEMLLFYACPRRDTNEIAHILINKFGSIADVIDADYDELTSVNYITENAATLLKILPAFMPVYYNSKSINVTYDNINNLKDLFKPYFVGLTCEMFRVACFDSRLTLIKNVSIESGDTYGLPVSVKRVTEIALREKAAAIALAHNHPDAPAKPSPQDIDITQNIINVMRQLRIGFLDHIIFGKNDIIAMKESAYTKFLA